MSKEILSWDEVKEEIKNFECRNLLVGNGFSLAWDHDAFKQENIKNNISYLCNLNADSVETCIGELQKISHTNSSYLNVAKKILQSKIHYDFMITLFKTLPKRTDNKKAEPFVQFLSHFNNYYTLNYDPLLYYLLIKYKKENIVQELEDIKGERSTKNNQGNKNKKPNVEDKVKKTAIEIIDQILHASWSIQDDKVTYLEEEITEQTHSFIRKKLISILKTPAQWLPSEINEMFANNKNRSIKPSYNKLINEKINLYTEGEIKEELKKLFLFDGFCLEKNQSIWKKTNSCNLFYLHGAYHINTKNNISFKTKSSSVKTMIEEVANFLDNNNIPTSILEGDSSSKITKIQGNDYLKFCYENLANAKGILITHGVSFADNDNHITQAIHDNKNLEKIYLGVFKDAKGEYPDLENYKNKFKNIAHKIYYYETNTATQKTVEFENSSISLV